MCEWERDHIVEALRFELGKVGREEIRERVARELAHVDGELAARVAYGLGIEPQGVPAVNHGRRSPALSLADQPVSVNGRRVAVLAADGVEASSLATVIGGLQAARAVCEVLAPRLGELRGGVSVDRALNTTASVLYTRC